MHHSQFCSGTRLQQWRLEGHPSYMGQDTKVKGLAILWNQTKWEGLNLKAKKIPLTDLQFSGAFWGSRSQAWKKTKQKNKQLHTLQHGKPRRENVFVSKNRPVFQSSEMTPFSDPHNQHGQLISVQGSKQQRTKHVCWFRTLTVQVTTKQVRCWTSHSIYSWSNGCDTIISSSFYLHDNYIITLYITLVIKYNIIATWEHFYLHNIVWYISDLNNFNEQFSHILTSYRVN